MYVYLGPAKTVLYEGLRENVVGITEYATATPGISGILKHRFEIQAILFQFNILILL